MVADPAGIRHAVDAMSAQRVPGGSNLRLAVSIQLTCQRKKREESRGS